MFENKRIKYLQIINNALFVRYKHKKIYFLTSGKVNLKDWRNTQRPYYSEAKKESRRMIKGWKERYKNYLKYKTYATNNTKN